MRPLLITLLLIDLILKGLALYKSARKGQNIWFVAILITNSLGILPLIYLLIQKGAEGKKEGTAPTISTKPLKKVKSKSKKKTRK